MRYILLLLFSTMSIDETFAQTRGDTLWTLKLKEVEIKDTRKWANDTQHYYFNQTKYYVQTILPYLDAATKLFNEMNSTIANEDLRKKERRRYINIKEDQIRMEFEDKIKSLNETQGLLLVKLIARQTGVNIYSMLNEFKSPFYAIKWLTWAKFNGFNLNRKYNPTNEPLLEDVMISLGYPLPFFYE